MADSIERDNKILNSVDDYSSVPNVSTKVKNPKLLVCYSNL
jgi:hypothetical protein